MDRTARRVSYIFLCTLPFLLFLVGGPRALRIPGVYQAVGGVLFAATVLAVWSLGARMIGSGAEMARRPALAGTLLIAPLAVNSLLWVGIGAPLESTPRENEMRLLVLLVGSISVTSAFVLLKEWLSDAGERLYSTVGFAANILAGGAYLVWSSFMVGGYALIMRDGQVPPSLVPLGQVFDILLFFGCVLTYLATAAYAASFGQTRCLGRGVARAYVLASFIALLLLVHRGLSYPDPTAWYKRPGFVAGMPAVPWIMPFLLGVVLLRRGGTERQ